MYRRQGSLGVLQGVLSGPYTGGDKRVDAGKLPRATRQRLADVLAGRAEPFPILYERPEGITTRFRPAWGLVVALSAIMTLMAIGFGDVTNAHAIQPKTWLVFYGAASLLFTISLLATFRRRARVGGNALVPGKYLFPLDVVDVPPADREGRQVIVVSPLGDARDASVRSTGRRRELFVLFESGAQHAFPLRADPDGEIAMRRLSRSQEVLEELTYGTDLAKTVALDPLFDIRVDASWDAVSPAGEGTPANVAKNFVARPAASVVAVALAGALAFLGLAGRNRMSDRALFLRALGKGVPEALDVYLEKGTLHRDDAIAMRDRLLRAREESKHRAEPKRDLGPVAESQLDPDDRKARANTAQACVTALRASANPKRQDVLRNMEDFVDRARRTGDVVIPVFFDRRGNSFTSEYDASFAAREVTMAWALERVFSETCQASLVRFAPVRTKTEAGLHVAYTPRLWKRHDLDVTFEITFAGPYTTPKTEITLEMPRPKTMPTDVRDRSLFTVQQAEAGEVRDAQLLTARAFDRLYDEIYGLFFDGNPRVPLREQVDPQTTSTHM